MILYKYASYEDGRLIIDGSSIGFASPASFNDPFEVDAYPRETAAEPGADMFARFRSDLKRLVWLRESAILCLTRSALNPLMWAHYGDGHRGFVVGLDAQKSGFTSTKMNLVPAQYGSVIYSECRPGHDLVARSRMIVGSEFSFRPALLEKLQRLFLHKPLCWSYEEEVRVVKCIKGIKESTQLPSGKFTVVRRESSQLYAVGIPTGAMVEVYLGARSPLVGPRLRAFEQALRDAHPKVRVRRCVVGTNEWALEAQELGT